MTLRDENIPWLAPGGAQLDDASSFAFATQRDQYTLVGSLHTSDFGTASGGQQALLDTFLSGASADASGDHALVDFDLEAPRGDDFVRPCVACAGQCLTGLRMFGCLHVLCVCVSRGRYSWLRAGERLPHVCWRCQRQAIIAASR